MSTSLRTAAVKPEQSNHFMRRGGLLQLKCACGAPTSSLTGECETCKSKMGLQAKLTIGASNDPLEQEADRVAEQVLAVPLNSAVRSAPRHIQRFSRHMNGKGTIAPISVDRALASSGRPLEPTLRKEMEQRFDHDFSRVRVCTGDAAEQSAREVNAKAYTVGHDIVFNAGQFAPETDGGRRLIAHELTHVVQQSSAHDVGAKSNLNLSRVNGRQAFIGEPEAETTSLASAPTETFSVRSPEQFQLARQPDDTAAEEEQSRMEAPLIETSGSKKFWQVSAPKPPGWVTVKPTYLLIKAGEPFELPHTIEVIEESVKGNYINVTINQGKYEGKDVDIDKSNLAQSKPLKGTAHAKFDKAAGQFWYGGNGPVDATTDPANPVPNGKHDIEIPDFQHSLGSRYGDYGTTWFRLGHSGDRYLHPGRISLGCTTIKTISEWPAIYEFLINSRRDNQNVGELEVI